MQNKEKISNIKIKDWDRYKKRIRQTEILLERKVKLRVCTRKIRKLRSWHYHNFNCNYLLEGYKTVIQSLEGEQQTLEKMLTNTQQSNSEMLDANRLVKGELRDSNTRVIGLQQELEEEEKHRIVTENKLLSLEKVFALSG